MNDENQKSLLEQFVSQKVDNLPIKNLILNASNTEKKSINFSKNELHPSLNCLELNLVRKAKKELKCIYIDSISKIIKSMSKEIQNLYFDIQKSELKQIIKSAYNWKRLIFFNCQHPLFKETLLLLFCHIQYPDFWALQNTDI